MTLLSRVFVLKWAVFVCDADATVGDVPVAGDPQGPEDQRVADARREGDAPDAGQTAGARRPRDRRLQDHRHRQPAVPAVGRQVPGTCSLVKHSILVSSKYLLWIYK